MSSADLMQRNLRNRIEQCTPIYDALLKDQIMTELEFYLTDTVDAWSMEIDGSYQSLSLSAAKKSKKTSAQLALLNHYTQIQQ